MNNGRLQTVASEINIRFQDVTKQEKKSRYIRQQYEAFPDNNVYFLNDYN